MTSQTILPDAITRYQFSGVSEELLAGIAHARCQLSETDARFVEATEHRAEAHEQTEKLRTALRALGVAVEQGGDALVVQSED